MENLYPLFGQRVRQQRRARKLSQEQLGGLTDMGRPTVAAIEAGRQAVALHQAVALSRALGVNLGELLEEPADPTLADLAYVLEDDDLKAITRLLGPRGTSR